MALEGTLKDFSLADILQLISLQQKTGLLTLRSEEDQVTLGFENGKMVSAESAAKRMDTRLGTVLVKTRRLSRETLQQALEIQAQTLQRLGFILLKNGFCSTEDLRDGLDVQMKRIVYAVFRWSDANYVFDPHEKVDYDHEFVKPLAVESLLMEGARMMDEWPIIEKVVRSNDKVYGRVPVGQPVEPAEGEDEVDDTGESTLGRKARDKSHEPIHISRSEWAVYDLIDGRRKVGDILERTFLSEFDGVKAFYDLISRGLIQEVKHSATVELTKTGVMEMPQEKSPGRLWIVALVVALGLIYVSFHYQARNPLNVLTRPVVVVETFEKSNSLQKLRTLSEAIDTFYLTTGRLPESVDALVNASLVRADDVTDPWGHRYRYILQPPKYYLVGFDSHGKTDTDLFFSHSIKTDKVGMGSIKSKGGKDVIVIK